MTLVYKRTPQSRSGERPVIFLEPEKEKKRTTRACVGLISPKVADESE